jgi:hypothetical protein
MKKLLGIVVLGLLLSGNAYAECIKGDCENGYGEYVFSSGDKYSGNWVKGKRSGQGIYEWIEGDKYEGGWLKNKYHGQGVITTKSFKYDGYWFKNKRSGQGIGEWKDGSRYDGEWLKDKYHGQGIYTYANGERLEGSFRKGKSHGEMTTYFPDGTIKVEVRDNGDLVRIVKSKKVIKQNNEVELASMINKAKNTCKTLGFEEGTEKFTDCSLKLYTQEVENKVALKVAEQKSSNTSNSGTMTIYDPVRDSQKQIDRGMKMLSGGCTLGIDC